MIGKLRASALANANTSLLPSVQAQHLLPPLRPLAQGHPKYRVARAYLSPTSATQKKKRGGGEIGCQVNPPPKNIKSFVGSGWYAALYILSCVTLALATTLSSRNRSLSAATSAASLFSPPPPIESNTNASWLTATRRGLRVCNRSCRLELRPDSVAPGSHSSCPARISRSSS
jgi:hypothetical protein